MYYKELFDGEWLGMVKYVDLLDLTLAIAFTPKYS